MTHASLNVEEMVFVTRGARVTHVSGPVTWSVMVADAHIVAERPRGDLSIGQVVDERMVLLVPQHATVRVRESTGEELCFENVDVPVRRVTLIRE